MPCVNFFLNLPPSELERMYQGVSACHAVSDQGLRVEFPAQKLRPFVTHLGVQGRFRLTYSDHGKFQSLVRLS